MKYAKLILRKIEQDNSERTWLGILDALVFVRTQTEYGTQVGLKKIDKIEQDVKQDKPKRTWLGIDEERV